MSKPSPGDLIAEKYRLVSILGEGGTSIVFAADNIATGKQVAIKWVLPDLVHDDEVSRRLMREAQVTGAIDHPNVVNVFDVGHHQGSLFLVMELLRGHPLAEELNHGPLDPHEFVKLMMPVLRGVQAAHEAGVVHRDLKPDNIFLCVDPRGGPREPKVLDFGISKLTRKSERLGQELTRAGTIFGTPQFMAPEQMRDSRQVNERSDIYALGAIFYRAISGAYPYDGETLTELAIRIVEGKARPLHERVPLLDAGLSEVVMRALALDPNDRFASVEALARALKPYEKGPLFSQLSSSRTSDLPDMRVTVSPLSGARSPRGRASPPPPPNSVEIAMRASTMGRVQVHTQSALRDSVELAMRASTVGRGKLATLSARDSAVIAMRASTMGRVALPVQGARESRVSTPTFHGQAARKLLLPPLPQSLPPPPPVSELEHESFTRRVPFSQRREVRTLIALSMLVIGLCMGSLALHAIASVP